MKNDNQTTMSHQDNTNIGTIIFGGFLALCNHIFGWMNTILDIHVAGFFISIFQALATGAFGAFGAFFTNKLLKRWEKKKHEKRS